MSDDPTTIGYHTTAARPLGEVAVDTRRAIKQLIALFDGVADVRLLPRARRAGMQRHKLFVVLRTHDVDRDRRILETIAQLEDVDIDLVPAAAEGLVPDGAESMLS